MRFPVVILVLLACVFQPSWAGTENPQTQGSSQTEKSEEQKQMDLLAQAGIRQALQVVAKSGGVYPFALTSANGEVNAVAYSGDPDNAPSQDDWASALFQRLREIGNEQPEVDMLSIYRLHVITDAAGQKTIGVWAEVDHRNASPWVIFVPLIKNAEGTFDVGQPLYQAAEQPLFVEQQVEQE